MSNRLRHYVSFMSYQLPFSDSRLNLIGGAL